MTKKQRIEYLVSTMCVLVTGFILYGFVGSMQPLINDSKTQSFLLFGCLGGFGFSMIVSSIILAVRYISKRTLKFKIFASVFWIITFACVIYVGIFAYFPYQIYNIVKIIKENKHRNDTTDISN